MSSLYYVNIDVRADSPEEARQSFIQALASDTENRLMSLDDSSGNHESSAPVIVDDYTQPECLDEP